jgi:DNA-binding CsgD family transcriptional regulator
LYKGRKHKLTPKEADELDTQARDGMTKAELARTYGISRETVYEYLATSRA